MQPLLITVHWNGKDREADLSKAHCIAIPLDDHGPQPNAYFAPLYEASPHVVNGWTGDTRKGGSVNFFNIRVNPHGNGTHTECVGHITKERYSIHHVLNAGLWKAQLISVYPVLQDNGDRIIDQLEWERDTEAIIIRTLPNHPDKMGRQYGKTNPPYLDFKLANEMAARGVQHLLLDLPSVDREEDAGALAAHKAFWNYPASPRLQSTITEMIYVDNHIPDDLYLLSIQIAPFVLDASPSRPFIYPLR